MSNTSLIMSDFAAGFWRLADWGLDRQARLTLIEQYLELGVVTMDHADIYGNYGCERLFGEALALAPGLRNKLQLVSKCGIKPALAGDSSRHVNHYDTSKAHIIASAERSLQLLGTDWLDLLLIHRPDPLMDADEMAEAFVQLRDSGKVRHFGVSNFTPAQFELLQSRLAFPLQTNQVELSPLMMHTLSDGTLDLCQQRRIRPMAWSCLGGGTLFSGDSPKAGRLRVELQRLMQETGARDMAQLIYAWVRMHPSRPIPIIGSGNIERIRSALASTAIQLDRQQWFSIWQAAMGHKVP
ncbi:aldo/keto reductase [Shewanella cyperi]|uniref:Aldo/keto reductase n=1 Tax=Shewanella cyperi TaxID=2814292 RepID=A0A974XJJ2_9GAMM|nr:aldo/keto reductase [Shewanella cyperi]QSX29587.1 aldo/keto reductase [Shewanella cyperi]